MKRNGGKILMQQLANHGVKRIFMVPGESYLPCIDALNDFKQIDPIVCRQESGAAYMAEAYGKLTGEPGICFVTRGPGATNASIGVHTAFQDSTPMILFVGQVGGDIYDKEAFQEIDYVSMFSKVAKWVVQINKTERIPEYISRAFHIATSGRPGPVVIALPEDTLWGEADVADIAKYVPVKSYPHPQDLDRLQSLIENAEKPLLVVGGSRWSEEAVQNIQDFADKFQLPVTCSWRRLECFNHHHPNFAGHMGWGMSESLRQNIKDADLVIALGTRLGEETTEIYTAIESPTPNQKLVHIHPSPSELNSVFDTEMSIATSVKDFATAAATLSPTKTLARENWVKKLRDEHLETLKPLPSNGELSLDNLSAQMNELLPEDFCITVGAGNYALYPHRYIQFNGLTSSLAPTVGSMGYGLPAAISCKLEHPEKTVVCYAGDGCFQMNLQELGVALQYNLGIVVLVFNNGIWGTIRSHQEREFPGRTIALDFVNPSFTKLCESYEGYGEVVDKTEDFKAAFERALAFANKHNRPALLEIRYDSNNIAPGETLMEIREQSLGAHKA